MLTRIEISGFKTFEDFGLDLGPFVVFLGQNASGKSNLFDALRLLSALAEQDLRTAVRDLRGDVHELFRCVGGERSRRITLAAEVLLDSKISDPWGAQVELTHTRIRYEVVIERRVDDRGIERLVVAHEEAQPILSAADRLRERAGEAFRKAFLRYRKKTPFLSTEDEDGRPTFNIHYDGKGGRKRPADAAEATVLSSMQSAEFPHLFALREELRSWRFLQLDPAGLRRPSATTAPETLEPDGSNLATVLARIRAETATEGRPKGDLADIAADLAGLVPGIVGLTVVEDRSNHEFRVDLETRDGVSSSRVVSDGTLRVLALLTMVHDPKRRGLISFEEPENGVHPGRLKALIARLRDQVSHLGGEDAGPEEGGAEQEPAEPLSQIILNSHSPVVLAALGDGEAFFVDLVSVVDPALGRATSRTRIRGVAPEDQRKLFPANGGPQVSRYEVNDFLASAKQA